MILALLLQAGVAQPLPRDVWATVSISPALEPHSETIEFLRDDAGVMTDAFTLRLVVRRRDDAPAISWASSRTCLSIATAVERLRLVPMPTPSLPGDPEEIVMDGVGYQVRFRAQYGSQIGVPMTLASNVGTPLARWVSDMFAILKPCWSATRPG